ncbi:MAG: RDD family protein [Candidatus Riflebacteria bacterium]|nr:RDD family protein [Candidatus Riflebacteria bacterium]
MTVQDPRIERLLGSAVEEDRRQAILMLIRTRPPRVRELLETVADKDRSAVLRYLARKGLAFLEQGPDSLVSAAPAPPPALSAAVRLLTSASRLDQERGLVEAIRTGERQAAETLLALLARTSDGGFKTRILGFFATHGRPDDLARLAPVLADRDGAVRAASAAALSRAAGVGAIPYLVYLLQDPDREVKAAARKVLAPHPKCIMMEQLASMTAAGDLWMRDSATYALGHLTDPEVVGMLIRLADDRHPTVGQKARRALERFAAAGDEQARLALAARPEPSLPPAAPAPPAAATLQVEPAPAASPFDLDTCGIPVGLNDPNPRVRILILEDSIERGDRVVLGLIANRLVQEDNLHVLSKLIVALGHLGVVETGYAVAEYLTHPDERVVASAVEALDRLGHEASRGKIRPMLVHRCPRIRANALLYFRDDETVGLGEYLAKMLDAKEYRMKLSGLYALSRLGPDAHGGLVERVLGDINDDVRERAFGLLSDWAAEGHADSKAMLEMCLAGDVDIKRESLFLVRAAPGRRILAWVIDLVAIGVTAGFLAITAASAAPPSLGGAAVGIVFAAGTLAFFVRDWANDGRGLGKKLVGLRVVDLASNRGCTRIQSLVRQAFLGLGLVGLVEFLLLHTDEEGRRIADRLVNTQVIEEKEQPLSCLGSLVVAVVYLTLAASIVTGVGSAFVPEKRTYRSTGLGYSVQIPQSWSFALKSDQLVVMKRRSLLRGEEINATLRVAARSRSLEAALRALDPRRPSWSVNLQDGARKARRQIVDELKSSSKEVQVEDGPAPADLTVAGERAVVFDVVFRVRGQEGQVRAVLFSRGERSFLLQLVATDRAAFKSREAEVEELLKGMSVT